MKTFWIIAKKALKFEDHMDENAVEFYDPDHSRSEDRFILIGLSFRLKILVVCHCFRESDSAVRIISARKAARKEREYYERRKT